MYTFFDIKNSGNSFCWDILRMFITICTFYFYLGTLAKYILAKSRWGVKSGKQCGLGGCCILTFTILNKACNYGIFLDNWF